MLTVLLIFVVILLFIPVRPSLLDLFSEFGNELYDYLARCRRATSLPLAVGFGIQNREDVAALIGRADMAVIGSRTIRLVDEEGPEAVGPFIASLR